MTVNGPSVFFNSNEEGIWQGIWEEKGMISRWQVLARVWENESVSWSVVFNSLDPMDYSPPGSSVHGILQAIILESVAIPFSRGSSQSRDRTQGSCIAGGFFTSWVTREAQEYWSVTYPFSSRSSQHRNRNRVSCIAGRFFTNWAIRETHQLYKVSSEL